MLSVAEVMARAISEMLRREKWCLEIPHGMPRGIYVVMVLSRSLYGSVIFRFCSRYTMQSPSTNMGQLLNSSVSFRVSVEISLEYAEQHIMSTF